MSHADHAHITAAVLTEIARITKRPVPPLPEIDLEAPLRQPPLDVDSLELTALLVSLETAFDLDADLEAELDLGQLSVAALADRLHALAGGPVREAP